MQEGFHPAKILNAAILKLISWWKMFSWIIALMLIFFYAVYSIPTPLPPRHPDSRARMKHKNENISKEKLNGEFQFFFA